MIVNILSGHCWLFPGDFDLCKFLWLWPSVIMEKNDGWPLLNANNLFPQCSSLSFWMSWGFFFIVLLGFRQNYFTHLSQVSRKVGRKWEIPEKNHLTTCKQSSSCLSWPALGSNPQKWDDNRFRVLNHSAMGAGLEWAVVQYKGL